MSSCRMFEVVERIEPYRRAPYWERLGAFPSEAEAKAAVEEYRAWWKATLPRDVSPGRLMIREIKPSAKIKRPEKWWIDSFKVKGGQ